MIMVFEGLQDEALEDVTGTGAALEPSHSEQDEREYVEMIMPVTWDGDAPDDGTGWGIGESEVVIFPVFDLLGEPWK